MENLSPIDQLVEIVRRLRAPGGCPWDREQTHESLRGGLVEETYEVIDAINRKDDANLREELGDLLLQAVFHAQIATEGGRFTFDQVAAEISEKLIRRHPHVFGDADARDSDEVLKQWDAIKRSEKPASTSVLGEIPGALPALIRAEKVQKRAGRVGFDWTEAGPVFDKVREELDEIAGAWADGNQEKLADELGDLLFAAVNLARHLKVEPEMALQAATDKFVRRFHAMEKAVIQAGGKVEETSADDLEMVWEQVKRLEPDRSE